MTSSHLCFYLGDEGAGALQGAVVVVGLRQLADGRDQGGGGGGEGRQ